MIRKFCALFLLLTLSISAGGMACGSTVDQPDLSDESDGATAP